MKAWVRPTPTCLALQRAASRQSSHIVHTGRSCFLPRSFSARTPLSRASSASIKAKHIKIKELPQGLIPLEPLQDESLASKSVYPTVVQQARNNMKKFEHCVLLTRVGSFYEMYFEQADEYGPLLNLKVAQKKTSAGPVSMAGFPFFQLDRFLKTLVQDHGKYVAISEEIAHDPAQKVKSGGLMFDRQVRRVVTPGTLIDEHFLSPYEHNYLLCIHYKNTHDVSSDQRPEKEPIGLAWLDLSSGDFFTQSTTLALLSASVARIGPREILLHKTLSDTNHNELRSILDEDGHLITYHEPRAEYLGPEDWSTMFEDASVSLSQGNFSPMEIESAGLLLQYVKKQLPGLKFKLQLPVRRQSDDYMSIDKNTLKGLEITQTMKDGAYKGSLLQVVRRTATESGARLLSHRLTSPSMSLPVINNRLDLVEFFLGREQLLEEIVELLRRTSDTLRLVQRFSLGRGDADDLLSLSRTIGITERVADVLKGSDRTNHACVYELCQRFQCVEPRILADRISNAIDQEGLVLQQRNEEADAAAVAGIAREVLESHAATEEMSALNARLSSKRFNKASESEDEKSTDEDVWVMRRTASPTLEQLHDALNELSQRKTELARRLKETLNAQTLSLKMTPGLGHICHVKGKDTKIDLSQLGDTRTVGSSKSTRSFYLPEWTSLGNRIEDAKVRIRAEEQRIFLSLREDVVRNLVVLRRNAAVLDELDVSCSFARLAREYHLSRPRLNSTCDHKIWGGRHLTVESGLIAAGHMFMPNNCILEDGERIWLITGPNMAGKSTFLRQTALISILAQTGSFVPAEYAEIGLVDQIFSRIGSADNLFQNQSTFMVEMLETAHILRNATYRSFVVMDEVGRGTTPEDGIAIGYALLHRLHNDIKCRTLFATHFHALTDMTKDFEQLACYCTNVIEDDKAVTFRYDHKLRQGVNRKSHALKVARLAGMPAETIKLAEEVLQGLKPSSYINNTVS